MDTTSSQSIPNLDPKLFWDVTYSQDSVKKYPEFVIERVIERGSQKDFSKILKYYGKNNIRQFLLHNARFNPKNKAFIKAFFHLNDSDLCSHKPSFPQLWVY
jgi:hypothetical protein